MKIECHTPKGIIKVDSDNVTDSELAHLGMVRKDLDKIISRDALKELDALQSTLTAKGVI